ncbi:MAG: hypothetical protein KAJ19_12635 [Gammaproteobacteria bacterium]|nr:hypothetical protein [Gammaproteobacteria bacterium]
MVNEEHSGFGLAQLDTVFGKVFLSPFICDGIYDHPDTPGWLSSEGISGPVKSVLLVQGTVRLYLTITAQEAFDILVKTAETIRERGEE